jgi:hypothetical protein
MTRHNLIVFMTTIVALAAAGSASAQAPVTSCQTISVSGSYRASGTLTANSGDCLILAANNISLDLANAQLSGSGTARHAILLEPTATGSSVQRGEIVGTWHTAVLDEASDSVIFNTDFSDANLTVGITVAGQAKQLVRNVVISDNDISKAPSSFGIHLSLADNCIIENNDVSDGAGIYSIWLDGSSNTTLIDNDESSSPNVGVYIGCNHSPASFGQTCLPVSSGNTLLGEDASSAKNDGIVIDLGDSGNRVFASFGSIMLDENPDCDSNVWLGNSFTSASPSNCIN